jgi:F0F1-type ATP synthase assembly protein I
MAQQKTPSAHPDETPQGDPWHAFGYLTSGVFFYGAIGWALDRWLGTSYLVVIGILSGAGLGLYLTWSRFRPRPDEKPSQEQK